MLQCATDRKIVGPIARASLWQDLCSLFASVHIATIRRLGTAAGVRSAADTVWKLQHALESAGVEFISEEAGKGSGVRLKRASGSRSKS